MSLSRFGALKLRQAGDEDDVDGLSFYSKSVISFNEQETRGSSSWVAGGKSKVKGKAKNECVVCSEIRDSMEVPCQQDMCDETC